LRAYALKRTTLVDTRNVNHVAWNEYDVAGTDRGPVSFEAQIANCIPD